ncbi:MAG: dethiobiotin synthase [Candidatus Kryptoniota bacterium]
MRKIFVTGIHTGIGKTVVSAILAEALEADYWKPVQAGDLKNSDTMAVKKLVSNSVTTFHPEAYRLTKALSPHTAAAIDGITIDLNKIVASVPVTAKRCLIIEGAGGAMSPVNNSAVVIDLIKRLNAEAIIVSRHYLGSINHTLLTVESILRKGIPLLGIIFNGGANKSSDDFIMNYSKAKLLGFVDEEKVINKAVIRKYAGAFRHVVD